MANRLQDSRGMLSLAVFLFLAGCGPKQEPRPDAGKLEDGIYKSRYFDLALPVPAGWEAKSPPSGMSRFLQYYLEALASKDKQTGLETRVVPMVRLASAPVKTLSKEAGFVTFAAARVREKRGFDLTRAVDIARAFLKGSPVPVKVLKDFHMVKLGGLTFVSFEAEWTLKDGPLTEAYYIAIRRGYVLVFSAAARGPKGLEKAKKALEALKT